MLRGLTDHAPGGMTELQRTVWDAVYWRAEHLYGGEWSAHVADKICADLWTSTGRARAQPNRVKLPDPGDMIWLGYAMSLQYFDPSSPDLLVVHKFTTMPDCLWSPRLQAVMVYPRLVLPPPTVMPEDVPKLLRLYRTWHEGKYPKRGASRVQLPDPTPRAIYPAAAIVYRSDKFDKDGVWVDYIHHHDKGARGQPGPMVYDGGSAWMLRGGRLELTADGLIH